MVQAASTVPDHGELKPYRFVIVDTSEGQTRFGDALAAAGAQATPDLSPGLLDKLRKKAFAAPALVVVIAAPVAGHKIPVWEQTVTASCTGYALVLAAHALGLGAIWKSAPKLAATALPAGRGLSGAAQSLGCIKGGHPARPAAPRPPTTAPAHVLGGAGLEPLRP